MHKAYNQNEGMNTPQRASIVELTSLFFIPFVFFFFLFSFSFCVQPPHEASFLQLVWAQLKDFIILVLIAAAVISAGMQDWKAMGVLVSSNQNTIMRREHMSIALRAMWQSLGKEEITNQKSLG